MSKLKYFLPLLLIFGFMIYARDQTQLEIYANLLIAAGYNYFLWTGTTNRRVIVPIGIATGLFPIVEILIIKTSTLPTDYFYIVMGIPTALTSVLAYIRYSNNGFEFYNFIKFLGLVQLSLTYLISFPGSGNANIILAVVYLTTRLTDSSKPPSNKMKGLYVFIIVVLSFLNIMAGFLYDG
ncbi:MAG: hypothetical protein RIC30_07965 [Marinoscillum sp.]|uniref:hypothetical protein n=1 Tax=Marinoscillum sp. TaxID=2024838 RepID=UPI0033029C9C